MLRSAVHLAFCVLLVIGFSLNAISEPSPRPLRASELLALQVGGALPDDLVHDIKVRGLSFHPDDDFLNELRQVGADATVLSALKNASVVGNDDLKDNRLVQELHQAAVLMKAQQYDQAASDLNAALTDSFAAPEIGFVMGELLRLKGEFRQSAAVYEEVLHQANDFPEVHTKLSYALYRMGDADGALHEAKLALAEDPQSAEAHKNAGLALSLTENSEAAIAEYKEALKIKPDYGAVHYDLGIIFQNIRANDDAIAEYKKAIALEPDKADYHTNLGNLYYAKGDIASAIVEQREAKRLDPNDPEIRQNLASALMKSNPHAAIAELQELERSFPNFEVCHVCLGRGLVWAGDSIGAESEFRKAMQLDPSDPDPHSGLAGIREHQKNYDAALEEFRLAEQLAEGTGKTHEDVGRVLLEKKDTPGALEELKIAESLSPSSWRVHDLYGQALAVSGNKELAIAEFKEAVALDSTQTGVAVELATALEGSGDWIAALEQFRKAALAEGAANGKHQPGDTFLYSTTAQNAYKAAQIRFKEHLAELRNSGKTAEATSLESASIAMENSSSTLEKVQAAMQSGDQALKEGRKDDGEKAYKNAVDLAKHLPAGNENLIVALGRLGRIYAMRQDYADAEATLHREMAIIEQNLGPGSERMNDPLTGLGGIAAAQKNYVAAENYFSHALKINLGLFGENSFKTEESLRGMAGLYMVQGAWPKAEPYLLRAVKSVETMNGPDDPQVLIPLWGLCGLYDSWSRPEKSQPCWHRATGLLEKQVGENGPDLATSITNEVNALRQLGRSAEADQLAQRLAKLHRAAQTN